MLLDRRRVKFWQKIVFSFMALLMVVFIMGYASFSWLGCGNDQQSAVDSLDEQIAQLNTRVAGDPQDAAAWTELGDTYVLKANQQTPDSAEQRSSYTQAVASYKSADEILAEKKGKAVKEQRLGVLQQLITTYLFLGDYEQATATYGQVTTLRPKDAQSYFDMATVAISAGDTSTALLAFSRFLELDPESPEAPQVKAWIEQNTPKSTAKPSPSPTND